MGINTDWIDERGKLLGSVEDPRMLLTGIVLDSNLDSTICLRFLDVAGDAYFNQLQLPVLVHELEALVATVTASEKKLHLTSVLKFVRNACGRTHTYVRFTGD